MPLLSYEGVEVDIPTTLQGIQFTFTNGTLTIQCRNFTGDIVMAKPAVEKANASMATPLSLGEFPSASSSSSDSTVNDDQEELIIQATQASTRSSSLSTVSSLSSSSKKRSIPYEQDDPDMDSDDSDESDLLRKRLRPNFLSDVEQTMLLAQLETSQQLSQRDTDVNVDMVDATQTTSVNAEEEAKSPEKKDATIVSPSDYKTPAKTKKATPTVSHMKSFFSPDPKELASKKKKVPAAPVAGASDSASVKKSGAARVATTKTKAAADGGGGAVSIRDMMMPTPLPLSMSTTSKTPPTATATATATATWSVVETKGNAPPVERWGHTVTKISDNRLVVYGGADDDEATLGDLHVFDIATNEWSKPLNCESIPRTWHDAVYLESKHLLLVFGGERVMGDDQLDVLSDIMVLDTECFLWYPPAVSGVTPTARSGHACTIVGNEIVVFGGSRGRSRQSSVHVLDSDAWHWKTVKIEGKPPTARTYHSATAVGGNTVVYFGGNDSKKSFDSVHVLKKCDDKVDTWAWFHPCVVGTPPRARTGHSATLLGDDSGKILIFGGWDPQSNNDECDATAVTRVFDDAFVLDTVTWEWEAVQMDVVEDAAGATNDASVMALPGRVGHSAVTGKDSNTVLLFGGQNAKEQRLNAVHKLTFSSTLTRPSTSV